MLGFEFDGYILAGGEAVHFQDIVQGVLGRGTLACGVEGFALQIRHGGYAFPALGDVHHAQGVDGQYLQAAACAVVEHGSQVGGQGGNVEFGVVASQSGRDFIGCGTDFEAVFVSIVFHHFHHAHGGGSFQGGDAHALCGSAGSQHHQNKHQDKQFFHLGSSPFQKLQHCIIWGQRKGRMRIHGSLGRLGHSAGRGQLGRNGRRGNCGEFRLDGSLRRDAGLRRTAGV